MAVMTNTSTTGNTGNRAKTVQTTAQNSHRGRRVLRGFARGIAVILALIVGLAAAGASYEAIAAGGDAKAYPPPGRLIDVGGYRLHIQCVGTGSPTVVLDAGLGGMSVMGGVQSGTMGAQGHYANGLAALYIACGQDAACVAESAVGITRFEVLGVTQ